MHAPIAAVTGDLVGGLSGHGSPGTHVLFEVPTASGIPDVLRVAFDDVELTRRTDLDLDPVLGLTAMRDLTAAR